MQKARSKKLLVLAIACTMLTVVTASAWGTSVFLLAIRHDSDGHDPAFGFMGLGRGTFALSWSPANKARGPIVRGRWFIGRSDASTIWWPTVTGFGVGNIIAIPLWMPTGLAFAATIVSWRYELRSRRRARAGLCPTCRYDLAATPTGAPCPECGTPTPAAPPTPAA